MKPVPGGGRCPTCGQVKACSEFSLDRSTSSGYATYCKPCEAERGRNYYQRTNGAASRARYVRRHPAANVRPQGSFHGTQEERQEMSLHGWRPEDRAAMWQAQDGLCYLCEQPMKKPGSRQVHVDHFHGHCVTGSCPVCRRGLACHRCNTSIGLAGDSPERLRLMADNLERAQRGVDERMMVADLQLSLLDL